MLKKNAEKTGMMSKKHHLKSAHLQRDVHYDVLLHVFSNMLMSSKMSTILGDITKNTGLL